MQTCIVPIISYNYAARNIEHCKRTLSTAVVFDLVLMVFGTLRSLLFPEQLLRAFTKDAQVIAIGTVGFRLVGVSFLPMVTSLTFPVFFQAVGSSLKSSALTVVRTVVLFVPLGYLFSRFGLNRFWLTFPVTEVLTSAASAVFYRQFLKNDYVSGAETGPEAIAAQRHRAVCRRLRGEMENRASCRKRRGVLTGKEFFATVHLNIYGANAVVRLFTGKENACKILQKHGKAAKAAFYRVWS